MQESKDTQKFSMGAMRRTWNSFKQSIPVILAVLLLISLVNSVFPPELYRKLFSGNYFIDPLVGTVLGSISGGNAMVSYLIGGELQKEGISLLAVTAFIVAWVTVGVVQMPAEGMILGKRFAFIRNVVSFIAAILVALITVGIVGYL